MNTAQAQEAVLTQLKLPLSAFGFRPAGSFSLIRPAGRETWNVLSFGVRGQQKQGFYFSCGVGIRFDCIERMVGSSEDDLDKTTVGVPLHYLRMDRGFDEWFFTDECRLRKLVPDVCEEVKNYALPFLQRYSSLAAVRAQLEKNEPTEWLGRTPEGRVRVLLGILALQEGPGAALRFFESVTSSHGGARLQASELLPLKEKIALMREA